MKSPSGWAFIRRCRGAFAAGAVFGALGFSLALATSPRETALPGGGFAAAGRSVGVALRFTNPFLASNVTLPSGDVLYPKGGDVSSDPDGFDLGDVAFGSSFARYINVAGGIRPYSLSFAPQLGSAGNPGAPPLPILMPTLSPAGLFSAAVPLDSSGATTLRFSFDVQDAIGTQRSGRFKLNLLPASSSFRHAQDQLPLAQCGDSYHTKLAVVGGAPPFRFTVVSGSVFLNGAATASLESLGLTLAEDGALYGRPLQAGTLAFTVRATDATFVPAVDRLARRIDQPYALKVEANSNVNTELAASSVLLRGSVATAGRDSFKYRGVIDLKGDVLPTLAGAPLSFRIGKAIFSGTLDDRGKLSSNLSERGKFSVSISRNGALSIRLANADLATALDASSFTDGANQTLILLLEAGKLRSAEVLVLPAVVKKGNYSLAYRLGKVGLSAGGAFQVLSVKGSDDRHAGGDRWLVRFLGVPRGIDGGAAAIIGKGGSVTLRIGQGFSQQITVASLRTRVGYKGNLRDPGVYQLYLDPKKFVHRLQTNVISSSATGIPTASTVEPGEDDPEFGEDDAGPGEEEPLSVFPFGMDLAGFSGNTGRVIERNNRSWKQH